MGMIYLFAYSLLCETLVSILILATPSLENPVFLGLSLPRLFIFSFVFLCILLSAGMLFIAISHKWFYPKLAKFFESLPRPISNIFFLAALFTSGLLILSFTHLFPNQQLFGKLRPLLLLFALLTVGACVYDVIACHHQPWNTCRSARIGFAEKQKNLVTKAVQGNRYLVVALLITFPMIFGPAFTYAFPSGFAGLYTLMSEGVANSGFRLPLTVSFYGPGGIPFAYPPAGFYLMAFFTSVLGIPEFTYLRFAPAIFMWLSMIPLALIAHKFTGSKVAAILAALVVSGYQHIFYLQTASGGIVRGLAFLLALWSIYCFVIAVSDASSSNRKNKITYSVFSGVLIGLTALTHFSYAQFAIFFVIAYQVTHLFSKQVWKTSIIAGLVSLGTAAPWVIVMVQRYGWIIFRGAFQSHGNDYILQLWNSPGQIIPWIANALAPILNDPILSGLILLALLYALFLKNKELLTWFALILLVTSESDRYLFVIGAILVGSLFAALFAFLSSSLKSDGFSGLSILFIVCVGIIFFVTGLKTVLAANKPMINADSLDIAKYVQSNTPKDARYLIVSSPDEAEWYPYLLQRVPAAGHWGSEWVGNYADNDRWVNEIQYCEEDQSIACVENIISELPHQPDLLLTHNEDKTLSQELASNQTWKKSYSNSSLTLWSKE